MKIYNTQLKKKVDFQPREEGKVNMYVCGPTVYNYFHIGNARPFIVFDAFRQYLKYRGYEVNYVQNFTDVDDKIIKRAIEEGITPNEVSEKYINAYFEDADKLGISRADVHPRVTENMDEIIAFIQRLIEKGHAYEVQGDVYFDVDSFEDYGKLSGQKLDELDMGSRIEVNAIKKNPMDFALWKTKKEGEIFWTSPWGEGRPGWHIECSVMSTKYLGETLDIHAGGQDLVFPHHENEVAQSEAYSGKKYVSYWMHNAYLNIDNKKMSKSLNNFKTAREILEEFDGEVVRFFMLSAHYRKPFNFARDLLDAAKTGLERIYKAKDNLNFIIEKSTVESKLDHEDFAAVAAFKDTFIKVMDDDFNTADGISTIFELVRFANTTISSDSSKEYAKELLSLLEELTGVIGILRMKEDNVDAQIDALIQERIDAKAAKNWARADEIRDELKAQGIVLEDTPLGVKWSREK